jgi:hypothetical protein
VTDRKERWINQNPTGNVEQDMAMNRAGAERRATGRNAPTLKYDLLTALGAHACAGDKHLQKLVLRLITLIVARYNWAADELSIGQREIAALWCLDERSVKRDIAKLKSLGWITVKRPAARGRVAVYGLQMAEIVTATRPAWDRVGSDFVARMTGTGEAPPEAPRTNVISFPVPATEAGLWPRMQALLYREDANLYGAWFAALIAAPVEDGALVLTAPSRFHASFIQGNHLLRLAKLAKEVEPSIARVEVRFCGQS